MHGLYTEGIYRKSGSTNKIKELRQGLDTGKIVPSKSRPNTCIEIVHFVLLKFSLHGDPFLAARRTQSFLWCLIVFLCLSKETLFCCGQFSKHILSVPFVQGIIRYFRQISFNLFKNLIRSCYCNLQRKKFRLREIK